MTADIHMTKCSRYDLELLRKGISDHLSRYDRFKDLRGKKILIKINLLSASDPESAVTTHPIFVEALILELKDRGASCIIADSPGGPFNESNLIKAYKRSGMTDVAERTETELNYITTSHEQKHPGGKIVKRFTVCDYMDNADLIIATPKIKTHMLTGLTCCSKIMFGAVPGLDKVGYHSRFPDVYDFSRMLLDLNDLVKPDLYLVDGIIGMDGDGPSMGNPHQVGVIMSGKDNHKLDLLACRIVGLDPATLPIMRASRDLGEITFDQVISASGDASDLRIDPAYVPASGMRIARRPPRIIRRIITNFMTRKPRIDRIKCEGCGVCKENCAGSAIEIRSEKAVIDYSKCIRCYCCHELCPYDAVFVKKSNSKLKTGLEKIRFSRGRKSRKVP
jgi:uncharacterized protein (DUF362 family)/Pyruvate/2-oxoacid:ferredoxin oxidoreductase delta subunit